MAMDLSFKSYRCHRRILYRITLTFVDPLIGTGYRIGFHRLNVSFSRNTTKTYWSAQIATFKLSIFRVLFIYANVITTLYSKTNHRVEALFDGFHDLKDYSSGEVLS